MDKASETQTLDSNEKKENIAKPIIELSKSQPLKTPSFSIFSIFFFLKYLSCTSSKPSVIQTQSLGDAIAQATLELKEAAEYRVSETVEQAALAVVEQAQVLKQVQADAEAQAKETILDPTTVKLLISVTDGVRVVTEKDKEKIEEQ